MTDLRTLVLRACARAEENGYFLDEDDEQEAIDIIEEDADVEALVPKYWEEFSERGDAVVAEVAGYVREYKNGTRAWPKTTKSWLSISYNIMSSIIRFIHARDPAVVGSFHYPMRHNRKNGC